MARINPTGPQSRNGFVTSHGETRKAPSTQPYAEHLKTYEVNVVRGRKGTRCRRFQAERLKNAFP